MSESDSTPIRRRRGIYLLPNLFTTGALFAGFYAIVAAMGSRFEIAAIAVLVATVLDGLDGRVARLTNTQSAFGAEYDSLADMVSFGVAPGLIMYQWALSSIGKVGWVAAFLFTACAALRLARFNTQIGVADKRFFQGLASPAAATLVVCLVWMGDDLGYDGAQWSFLALLVTIAAALLMVSRFAYYSFKDFGGKNRIPFVALILVVIVFAFTATDPPKVIFTLVGLYALAGPAVSLTRYWRRRGLRARRDSDESV